MEKLSEQNLISNDKLQKEKVQFKNYLEKEFDISKIINQNLSGSMVLGQDLNLD